MQNAKAEKEEKRTGCYRHTQMQKDLIIEKLKERGLRITRQRRILLDIILEGECSCCKEIYYRASALGPEDRCGNGIPYDQYAGVHRSHQPQKYVPGSLQYQRGLHSGAG